MMKKILLIAYLCIAAFSVHAQTSPTPYNLSSGAYTFTAWDSLAPALSYPTNMMFHTLGNQNPDENTPANGDWACAYQSLNGCWIQGKDTTGVAFRNIEIRRVNTEFINGKRFGNCTAKLIFHIEGIIPHFKTIKYVRRLKCDIIQ